MMIGRVARSCQNRFLPILRQNLPTSVHYVPRAGYCQGSLLSQLRAKMKLVGPMSLADYMREVLTNPTAGYYMGRDVFGVGGDFITSPEISQVFGELLAVWCIYEWQQTGPLFEGGATDHLQIVELGPGRGTLAHDMIRVFSQFPDLKGKISLHFVEVSPKLSQLQCEKLTGYTSPVTSSLTSPAYMTSQTSEGIDVAWYRQLSDVPRGFSCFVAHEFFDALPIYKFQKIENNWREVLVSLDRDGEKLVFMLAPGATPASSTILPRISTEGRDHIEVCPEGGALVQEISRRVETQGGMALIADYGHTGDKTDTFRAFKNHQLHDPLTDPGSADLTADVDFSYLDENLTNNVSSFGPVSQSEFLHNMGIGVRLKVLYEKADEKQRKDLISAYDMLTNPEQMGERFKFFTVFPRQVKESGHIPAGFEPLS